MADKTLLDLVIENPHGLGEAPPEPQQPKVFFDEQGQPYDEQGRRIKVEAPADPTLGESLLNIAESPAKMLVGAVSEPISALQRLAENSVDENGGIAIPNPDNPQNREDVITGLLSLAGGNALNPAASVPKGALASGALRDVARVEAPRSLDVGRMREAQAAQSTDLSSLFSDLRARGMLHSDTPMPRRSPDAAVDTWNQERQFENAFADKPLQPGEAIHATYPDDPSRFLSRFNHDGRVYEAEGSLGKDGTAELDWIGPADASTPKSTDANTLGRGALKAWRDSFIQQFPDTNSFSGERISGARRAANDTANPRQTVSALFSDQLPSLYGAAIAGERAAANPVRAFHSTNADFERFDPAFTDEVGFHFGNKDQAQTRQMVKGGITSFINPWSDWRTIPVNIETQNPASLSRDVQRFTGERVANQLVRDGIAPPSLLEDIAGASPEQQTKYVRDWLVSNGYDAVKYPNNFEGGGAPSYMALGTGNVKHAKTGEVLYSGAPSVPVQDDQEQPSSLVDIGLLAQSDQRPGNYLKKGMDQPYQPAPGEDFQYTPITPEIEQKLREFREPLMDRLMQQNPKMPRWEARQKVNEMQEYKDYKNSIVKPQPFNPQP
jgi:hypothetical protein